MFLSSCDKYEFIDKNTRFNKRTGEVEILQNDGKWKTRLYIIREKERIQEEKERIIEEKRLIEELRILERDSKLKKLLWGSNEEYSDREIIYRSGNYVSSVGSRFSFKIKNYSDYEIEMFIYNNKYSSIKDSTLLFSVRDTLLLDIDSPKGKPGSVDSYSISRRRPLDDEYISWDLGIFGIKSKK